MPAVVSPTDIAYLCCRVAARGQGTPGHATAGFGQGWAAGPRRAGQGQGLIDGWPGCIRTPRLASDRALGPPAPLRVGCPCEALRGTAATASPTGTGCTPTQHALTAPRPSRTNAPTSPDPRPPGPLLRLARLLASEMQGTGPGGHPRALPPWVTLLLPSRLLSPPPYRRFDDPLRLCQPSGDRARLGGVAERKERRGRGE